MKNIFKNIMSGRGKYLTAAVLLLALPIVLQGFGVNNSKSSVPQASAANVDYFLKIDGIEGESTDKDHKEWIDILSWSWGASTSPTAGTSRQVAQPSDFSFSKSMDKASPKILEALVSGRPIPSLELEIVRPGAQQAYYKITMKDVLISSIADEGSNGSVPTETFSLNFEEIKVEYGDDQKKGTGKVEYEWKVEEGES